MISSLKSVLILASIILAVAIIPFTGHSVEIMTANGVSTCDLSGNPRTHFNPGDDIRYEVDYTIESPIAFVLIGGNVNGANLQENLHWQYGILPTGTYSTFWDKKLPPDTSGTATVTIMYIGVIDEITVKETSFTIGEDTPNEPTNVGSNICGACHSEIFDSLKDSAHGFIECETCHGPGSNHVNSPSTDTITIDKSSDLCGQCHTRGDDQNRIEVKDGLIKSNQQYDELLNGEKSFFNCVQCHDPHVSLNSDTQDAITSDCSSCHSQTINRIHSVAGLECLDCHMPNAVKVSTASGEGDHLKGDGKSHIFTIDTTANPSKMFYPQSGKTFSNGFLTLNFVCLGCHNGILAKEREFDWALQGAALIHSE